MTYQTRIKVDPIYPDGRKEVDEKLEHITRCMNEMVQRREQRGDPICGAQTTKEAYLDRFASCLDGLGVSMIGVDGCYRDPKAILFDLMLTLNAQMWGK